MRFALAGLALLAPLAAAQDEGRFVEHGTWTQFEPAWREGPATVAYGAREAEVADGARYATDGGTWFYATSGAEDGAPASPSTAATASPGTERSCSWTKGRAASRRQASRASRAGHAAISAGHAP